MSSIVLKRKYEMQLPINYVEVEKDEMEYIDGGAGIPNWMFAGIANSVVTVCTGGVAALGARSLGALAKRYGMEAAKTMFSRELKQQLIRKGVAAGFAANLCRVAEGSFTLLSWATDPGSALAEQFDARDSQPNDGWCDFF